MADTTDTRIPMPTIGADRYSYAKLLTDTVQGRTYGAIKRLQGMTQIAPTDTADVATFDADNGAYVGTPYVQNQGHTLTTADITPQVMADWKGVEMKDGGVEIGGTEKPPEFGVAWRIMKSDGSYRYIRYYRGTYSFPPNVGGQTKPSTGAPNYQTAQATFRALAASDGAMVYILDENDVDASVKSVLNEKWFTDFNWYPSQEE